MMAALGPLGIATTLGRTAWSVRRQWRAIPAERRGRLQRLVRQSGGRPSALSATEREELRELLRELELGRLARQGAMSAVFPRRRFRRGL